MKDVRHDIRVFHKGDDLVGECPTWNVEENALYWVDTRRPLIRRQQDGGNPHTWSLPTGMGAFAFRATGGIVAGMQNGFDFIDLDTGVVTPIHNPSQTGPRTGSTTENATQRGGSGAARAMEGASIEPDRCIASIPI
jgi:sugar lactone lactonase YvrE